MFFYRNSMLISLKEKGGTRLPTDKSMIIIGKLNEIYRNLM